MRVLRGAPIPLQIQSELAGGPWPRQRAILQLWQSSTRAVAPSDLSSCLPSRGPLLPASLGALTRAAARHLTEKGAPPLGVSHGHTHISEVPRGPLPGELARPLKHMHAYPKPHTCTRVHTCLHAGPCTHIRANSGVGHEGRKSSCGLCLWVVERRDRCVCSHFSSILIP